MSTSHIYTYLLILTTLLLSGCGSSKLTGPVVIFDEPLQVQIPEGYETVSPGIVENKQITNQILKAYKKPNADDPTAFQDNFVITKSEFVEPLDYDQFWTINQRLMQNQLVGYQPGTLERSSFDCAGSRINMLVVDFALQGDVLQHFVQAQFVQDDIGYILSFASNDLDTRDDTKDWIGEISCGEESTE